MGTVISVLKMRQFRLRYFTFAQIHTTSKWRSWNTMPKIIKLHQIPIFFLFSNVFTCFWCTVSRSSSTRTLPASSLNSTPGGPCGSSVCQEAAPPLILLSQANTPTQNHKIKLQMLTDVQQPLSSHSHLPHDPGLIVLTLISPVLNSWLSLYSPRIPD